MVYVKCPKCGAEVEINIARAIDEHAEVYRCDSCGYKLRYTNK